MRYGRKLVEGGDVGKILCVQSHVLETVMVGSESERWTQADTTKQAGVLGEEGWEDRERLPARKEVGRG